MGPAVLVTGEAINVGCGTPVKGFCGADGADALK